MPDRPPVPIPVTAMPQAGRGQRAATETGPPDPSRLRGTIADPNELPVAQGQEMLGPCRDCAGYWSREIVRGQKPLTCPVCKREGPPA